MVEKLKPKRVEYSMIVSHASIYLRIMAFLLDFVIVGSIAIFIESMLLSVLPISLGEISLDAFLIMTMLIYWMTGFLYGFILESRNGQTFGKAILYLMTVDDTTLRSPELKENAINNILKFSPFLIFDILVGIIKNRKVVNNQARYTQNLSHTIVVQVRR